MKKLIFILAAALGVSVNPAMAAGLRDSGPMSAPAAVMGASPTVFASRLRMSHQRRR